MKPGDLRFLPMAFERKELLFTIGSILGIPVSCLARHFELLPVYTNDFSVVLTGGTISVALLVASLLGFIPDLRESKSSSSTVLYPVTLILLSVILAAAANLLTDLLYFAVYYLLLGIVLFLNEVREIVSEHTIGATLLEKATFESSHHKLPHLGEESLIARQAFARNLRIDKGDAVLAKCAFIQDGRLLVRRILEHANYLVYISADRPHTMVMEELKQYREKLYCIDCFTNVYGFGEFKQSEGESRSYTLKPTTVKQLHETLRDVRRQTLAHMCFGKDWCSLSRAEAKRVATELGCKEASLERDQNVWMVYDSISSLAQVFEMGALLKFLIHDTTVDTLIGRNTLLLVKDGVLEEEALARVESVCEHILSVEVDDGKICIGVDRAVGQSSRSFDIET
jgi:hypothetical protein